MRHQLRIALPKGRLADVTVALFQRAGIRIPESGSGSRKLTFMDLDERLEFVSLKPLDIPVYVESGAVDGGVVGSDILRELECEVYEPLDLRIGRCRMVLAAPEGAPRVDHSQLTIATKYPRTAERHFRERQQHVHVVRLDGSVEIAPLLGLADAIVDLVETGVTLRDNHLHIVEEVAHVSAKLIVNRTAMKMRSTPLGSLIEQLDTIVYAHP